jgi:AcrR family transcriptional regulator
MSLQPVERSPSGGARRKLLEAAFSIIRQKGYAATSVDELCARAGVTKGAFFHHFPSKDSLAVAAVNQWTDTTAAFFAAAPYHGFDVLQGAFILAKAKGNAAVVEASIDHLRRYIELLFRRPKKKAIRKN